MKTKNRLLASVLCLLMVVFCVVGLTDCGGDDKCSHQWGEWSTTTNATCTEAGSQERKCSECGETETSTIAALGHDWNEATCSTPKTCKVCSATEGTASAHAYTVETVKDEALKSAATCTSAAVYYKSCSCGAVSTNDADTFTNGSALDHVDANTDHACDYNCGENVGICEDANKDHACDYGCNKAFGEHADGDDNNHLCDYGCGKIADEGCYDTVVDGKCDECSADINHTCVDSGKDHACDICSTPMGEHSDGNKDHNCDYGCADKIGTCADADKDHDCDYGCEKVFGTCEDADKDHDCDYGCTKTFGAHTDGNDNNHLCDYGCGQSADEGCYDTVVDGKCDECGADIDHDCVDENKNHACDICSANMGEHVDTDKDHACDYGCNETFGTCEDTDFDHACDYGCNKVLGTCEDKNKDHECDHGCEKPFGEHSDSNTDDDHVCDYGCGAVIESCSDVEDDGDHNCDVCNNADITDHSFSNATCGAPATCSECGATTGSTLEHKDENHDHICDNDCGKTDMGNHSDLNTDNDHVCDYGCGAVLENCSDVETDDDHDCDVCNKANVTSHAHVENTALATEATCKAAATKTYECNCGDTYTEDDGDALGHNITGAVATERHVNGCEYVLVYVCQNNDCGEEVLGETVYHHNYVASIKTPATCTTPGEKTFECSACGDTSKEAELIPADTTGHNWTTGNVVDGVRTDTCSVCSETKTVTVYTGNKTDEVKAEDLADKEIELNDANISLDSGVIDTIGNQNVTVSADKLEGDDRADLGLSEDQLAQVGDSPIYNFTINNGTENISNFGEENYVTITLPYTLTPGEDVDSIAVWFINDEGELESIPATYNNGFVTFKTNHFSYYTVTRLTPAERCALYGHGYVCQHVEGSCTKDAYDLYVCVRCHDKYTDENTLVIADGHDYTSETHNATCTENGYVLYTCDDCGHSYRTKINATGHSWSEVDSGEVSCTVDGFIKYGCDNCDEEYTVTYVKTGHVYTNTVVPATCAADGYTIHDCDNCDYSYTDTYVDALGHNYEAGEWTWEANGNKATLTLVCEHDETHTTALHVISTMEKEVEKGACSNYVIRTHTATVEYNGVTYTDVMVIRQGNPTHNFSTDWTADENEHWHECVCGEKIDVTEHTFENATTTKNPTCNEAGESTSYCSVCGEAKVTTIPATGDHNYVDGFCNTCGKEEVACDHTDLHKESIDLGELGVCDWVLYYFTCECGEVKVLVENSDINCDFDEVYEEDKYVDENGNTVMTMKGACHCGLEVIGTAVVAVDGCTESHAINYVFKFNGEIIIDMNYVQTSTWHQNTERATIDLSEYGTCGGSLIVYKCTDCGEITDIYDFDVDCNVDLESEPEVEQITDENGVVHYIQKVECPDCDLALVVDMWVDQVSVCETIMYMTTTVRYGETKIVELYDTEYDDNHEYEYEYELEGESCEDGVKITAHCTICGDSYSTYREWHSDEEYDVVIDLSEHSSCGGTLTVDRCKVCGYVTNISDADINCDMSDAVKEEITDAEGNVIGYKYISTCPDCGLMLVEQEWIETHSVCECTEYEGAYIYKGEECIFTYVKGLYQFYHKYEYTYETEINDCNEIYKVIGHCTVCGKTEEWLTSGHIIEDFEMNLADHNGCAGTISGQRCAICGEVIYLYDMNIGCNINGDATPDEIVGEDGITHYVMTMPCPDCGLTFVTEKWEIQESACVTQQYQVTKIYSGDDCIFEYTNTYGNTNHQFEYEYKLAGETCDYGYYVIAYCPLCGQREEYHSWEHRYDWRNVDLGELGLCSGLIEENYCSICDTVLYLNINDHCYWEFVEENADGYDVYECQNCGAMQLVYSHDSEKDDNCEYKHTEIVIYIVNGEEVYRYERTYWVQSHKYQYEYILNGSSCTDGYRVIRTCEYCDYHSESTSNYHEIFVVFEMIADEGHEGVCNNHYVRVHSCPCGQEFYIDFVGYSFRFDKELQMYVCDNCDIAILYNITEVEEGCSLIVTTNFAVYYDGVELYCVEKEETYTNHNFTDVQASVVDGVTYVTTSCDKCDTVNSTEILSVELEYHNGTYYYDYTFTPDESAMYSIVGLADRDTYVTLYKVVVGQLVEISHDDDGSNNSQFLLNYNLTAGTTYVYRINFYNSSESGSISFALTKAATSETACRHGSYAEFSVLLDGSETCEDGVLYGRIYDTCGCIGSVVIEYNHRTIIKDIVDLAENGACYGELVYYSCACGQEHNMYPNNLCWDTRTDNEYYDEEGRLIHVDVLTCSECGLRYTSSYYTVKDHANCTLTYYYTDVINVGGNLIAEMDYTVVEVNHDDEVIGTLMNGAGSSCEDGVVITYKCKDCEREENYELYYHETYEKEHINLFDLGSVCGGYATVYGCACGERGSLSLDHSLCELGSEWCELWIEDAITGSQPQINGWHTFGYSSYLYICAVTDPEDAACAYKIRYANYWLKDENSCMAYRYETWQFGYNEETGTYEYAVTFKTGSSRVYHNYVDGSTDNHVKYDCPDCGSYYYENRYYDDNNNYTKYEKLVSNTLDNGYDKYYEYIEEYAFDANGNRYVNREYLKIIYSDGNEYWYEKLGEEEVYVGAFGDPGRKVSYSYSDSYGESYSEEYAYVWYKGYEFREYTYRIEGDYWYRYDYTYTFDNGCVQIEVYTDSEGEREENTNDICRFRNRVTIKNPTCTQDGEQCNECVVCGKHNGSYIVSPNDHNWVQVTDNWYYCFTCGLENANGVSGDIIMEDLTDTYGNGEYYVVGYYARNNVEFSKYVSLVLADGTTIDVLTGIEFTTIDGIRAYAFRKAEVEAWAAENGYTDFDVRFSFVPVGSDGSFDYGVTFTETIEIDTIIDDVSFTDYIGAGETKSYTITPTEDGVWTFTSYSNNDTYGYLYDAEGNRLTSDDDGGYNNNFKITYELKAGETYIVKVRWFNSERAGNVALLFGWEAVVSE